VPVAVQVSRHKARLAELQALKQKHLEAEDFFEAQRVKDMIAAEEAALVAIRQSQDTLPTPTRSARGGVGADVPAPPAPAEDEVPAKASAEAAEAPSQAQALEEAPEAPGAAPEDRTAERRDRWRWKSSQDAELMELHVEPKEGEEREHPVKIPMEIFERLYEYQKEGVAWLASQWHRSQGGILADEMGLGKTVQLCAFLAGVRKSGATHALILLPVTLLDQWAREAKVWCPGWPVYTYYGTAAQRSSALRGISLPQGGILLTSYSMLSNTDALLEVAIAQAALPPKPKKRPSEKSAAKAAAKRRKLETGAEEACDEAAEEVWPEAEMPPFGLSEAGQTRAWDVVVCDEAHRMKNISTLVSKSLRRLRSRCRLLLTGTPVQNALQDMWALMDFAQPGLLGNHSTFVKQFSEPIDRGSVRGASPFAVALKSHLAKQLRGLMAPHLLRRTKVSSGMLSAEAAGEAPVVAMEEESIQEAEGWKPLLPKRETVIWLLPTEEQEIIYKKVLEKSDVIRQAAEKGKLGVEVFQAIGLLKRLSNHPLLVLPMSKPGAWKEVLGDAVETLPSAPTRETTEDAVVPTEETSASLTEAAVGLASEQGLSTGAVSNASDDARAGRAAEMMARRLPRSADSLLAQSAKLRCLALLLPALAKRGHRTLVFSQSVKMLDLVQICVLKPNGLRCLRIDGKTDAVTRGEKVLKFEEQQDRFQCMLLTTSVGGVGLNLTSADRVIMVDPAWNPASDAQAVDRAYRIGQEKEVRVYRLITSGLIEDKMFRLQVFKMGLQQMALGADQQQDIFSSKEIKALFEWGDPAMGESRKLLRDKFGEASEDAIKELAVEDGALDEGWLGDWLAAGASDFSALSRAPAPAAASEVLGDEAVAAEVEDAKQRLKVAEESATTAEEAFKAAEERCASLAQGIVDAGTAVTAASASRKAAEETLSERRGAVTAARKAGGTAQLGLQKLMKVSLQTKQAQGRDVQMKAQTSQAAENMAKSAEDARSMARSAEETSSKAFANAAAVLEAEIWDEDGKARVDTGVRCPLLSVDVKPEALTRTRKALERVRAALDVAAIRQAEVEAVEDELLVMDQDAVKNHVAAAGAKSEGPDGEEAPSPSKADAATAAAEAAAFWAENRPQLEQVQERSHQKSDAAREAASKAVSAFVEAGLALVESFYQTQHQKVKAAEVKKAKVEAKDAFKQLGPAWTATRKAQETWLKASAARAKADRRAGEAAAALVESDAALSISEEMLRAALQEDAERTEELQVCETRLCEAEAARCDAEADEIRWRQRREELKAEAITARGALIPAKAVFREAAAEQSKVFKSFEKVEKAQLNVEKAKHEAVERLLSEEYNATQVVQAYELQQRRKGQNGNEDGSSPEKAEEGAGEDGGEQGHLGSPVRRLRSKTKAAEAMEEAGEAQTLQPAQGEGCGSPTKRLRTKTKASELAPDEDEETPTAAPRGGTPTKRLRTKCPQEAA